MPTSTTKNAPARSGNSGEGLDNPTTHKEAGTVMTQTTDQRNFERTDAHTCPPWCRAQDRTHDDDSHEGPHRVVRDDHGGWVEIGSGTMDGVGFMVSVDTIKVPMLAPDQARTAGATLIEFADWCDATAAGVPDELTAGSVASEIAWIAREAKALRGSDDEARRTRFMERKQALLAHIERTTGGA